MRELRQFVEVADRHSISAAAKHLNISQPALSRSIQKLEESYGAPLFIRNGAGVELSPFGSALYSRALRILPALDEAREEIEQLQGRSRAVIRIASGDLWGLVILPQVTRHFSATHPHIIIKIEIVDERQRIDGLRNGVYDLAFGTLSLRPEDAVHLRFDPLVSQATFVYADAAHPLIARGVASPQSLLEQRWINPGYENDAGPGYLLGQARIFSARVNTVMHGVLLLRGSPFVMAASSGFQSLFAEFGVGTIPIEDFGPPFRSGAIYPERSLEKAILRDFLRCANEYTTKLLLPKIEEGAARLR